MLIGSVESLVLYFTEVHLIKFACTGECSLQRLFSIWRCFFCSGDRPVKRGEVFLGPATFWRPHHRSKILKNVFQMASFWPQICIKSIFGRGCAPDPAGGAYDAFQTPGQMVRGHPSPWMPLASRFRCIHNRVVTGPCCVSRLAIFVIELWSCPKFGLSFDVLGLTIYFRTQAPNVWPDFINLGRHRTCVKIWWRLTDWPQRLGAEQKK